MISHQPPLHPHFTQSMSPVFTYIRLRQLELGPLGLASLWILFPFWVQYSLGLLSHRALGHAPRLGSQSRWRFLDLACVSSERLLAATNIPFALPMNLIDSQVCLLCAFFLLTLRQIPTVFTDEVLLKTSKFFPALLGEKYSGASLKEITMATNNCVGSSKVISYRRGRSLVVN